MGPGELVAWSVIGVLIVLCTFTRIRQMMLASHRERLRDDWEMAPAATREERRNLLTR